MNRSGELTITTPGDREIVLSRVFDAPRDLVFEALSKPELVKQWLLGPPGWSMIVCEIDLKVGGGFRYVWRDSKGAEMAMRGVYREIVPNQRVVSEDSFEFGCEAQAGKQVATTVLTEDQGRTTFTCTVVYPSKAARDATIASGMEKGVAASYARLAQLVNSEPRYTASGAR